MLKTSKFLIFLIAVSAASSGWAAESSDRRPLILRIEEPKGTPLLLESGWTLAFQVKAREGVGFFDVKQRLAGRPDYKILIIDDPDDCLDLSHTNPYGADVPLDICPGGADETFIVYDDDVDDRPSRRDESTTCLGDAADRLIDTDWFHVLGGSLTFNESNKAHVNFEFPNPPGLVRAVGPDTGGIAPYMGAEGAWIDCYGFGADDDLPSLVVMVNIGPSRIFDVDRNYDNTRIRNMAGFISTVTTELSDRRGRPSIIAHMPVPRGLLEPFSYFDLSDVIPEGGIAVAPNPVIGRQIEDGPLETFSLTGITSAAEYAQALIDLLPGPYEVEIRAVVVEGTAPSFVDDNNGDGRFTARDLTLGTSPYTLLSNESVRRLNLIPRESLSIEEDDFECPEDNNINMHYIDLNGDGVSNGCQDGDGTSRSVIRIPR